MALIEALILLLCSTALSNGKSFADYHEEWKDPNIDTSAVQTCWVTGGTFSEMESGNPVKGHMCSTREEVWTDPDSSMDYCRSRFPYHILRADSKNEGGKDYTECDFQVNLVCDPGWWQIHGKCYQVLERPSEVQYTYADAKKMCENFEKTKGHKEMQIAEYHSPSLGIDLLQLEFTEVWVSVPDWSLYYDNTDNLTDAGVFVLDNAYKYNVEEGTIIIPDDRTRPVLCQYTPAISMAESFMLAKSYKEIYPIFGSDLGVTLESSSYTTITQTGVKRYDNSEMAEKCKGIGRVLQVASYPQTGLEDEFKLIRSSLKNHRYVLTGAVKPDGKEITAYRDINPSDGSDHQTFTKLDSEDYSDAHSLTFTKSKRVPAMAAMRAPALCAIHSFKYETLPCEPAPSGWALFEYKRSKSTICHYMNGVLVQHDSAHDKCQRMDKQLSGFETKEEMNAVIGNILSTGQYKYHYHLGGDVPCKSACSINPDGTTAVASWNPAVSVNNQFLHDYGNTSTHHDFNTADNNKYISIRADVYELHTHNEKFDPMGTICASYAKSKAVKIEPKNTNT